MRIPRIALAAVAAAAMSWSVAAQAAPGAATGDVNMRTGPGTSYAKITTIPAGAPVEVFGCNGWCEVAYGGTRGWVSANYITRDVAYAPDRVYRPAPRRVVGPAPVVIVRDPMPPRAYWRYGRPWWDDRYDAWYDGRYYWHDGRWWDGPPRSGVSLDFRF